MGVTEAQTALFDGKYDKAVAEALLAVVDQLGSLSFNVGTVNNTLMSNSANSSLGNISTTLALLLNNVNELMMDYREDKAERNKEELEHKWETEWFVEAPPRKPVKFDTEEEALVGAHEARSALGDGVIIHVYCTELKRYKRESSSEWEAVVGTQT